MLLFLACAAPDDSGTPPAGLPDLPVSRACLVEEGADPADAAPTVDVEVAGRVLEVGTGEPPGGCRDRAEWTGAGAVTWDELPTHWLRVIAGDGVPWVVAATNPWIPDPAPLLDAEVELAFRDVLPVPFDGVAAETELELATGGYAFYLGRAATLADLDPWEEVALAVGPVEATWEEDCGHGTVSGLSGTRDGDAAVIATGDSHGFDGVGVWNGGLVTAEAVICSETDYAFASVFEWRMD